MDYVTNRVSRALTLLGQRLVSGRPTGRLSPGIHPLTKKPSNSGFESDHVARFTSRPPRIMSLTNQIVFNRSTCRGRNGDRQFGSR